MGEMGLRKPHLPSVHVQRGTAPATVGDSVAAGIRQSAPAVIGAMPDLCGPIDRPALMGKLDKSILKKKPTLRALIRPSGIPHICAIGCEFGTLDQRGGQRIMTGSQRCSRPGIPFAIASGQVAWRRSSHSGAEGNCVEAVGPYVGVVAVRDSKDPQRIPLLFTETAWREFTGWLKSGRPRCR